MKYKNFIYEFILCLIIVFIVSATYYYLFGLEYRGDKSQILFIFLVIIPISTQAGIYLSKRRIFKNAEKFLLFSFISLIFQILSLFVIAFRLDSGAEINPISISVIIIIVGFLGYNLPYLIYKNEKQ
jgi:hypothetical protein